MEKTNKNKRSKKEKLRQRKSVVKKIRTKQGKNMDNREYLSMGDYISLAKKTVNKFAPKFYNGLNKEILSSEDAISDIASAIMYADWRFDPNREGSSGMKKTLYSYRNQCAIWAIQTYITNKYKKKPKEGMSLDYNDASDQNASAYHESITDKKQRNPLDILIQKEEEDNLGLDLDTILNSDMINDKQKQQLQMYYMEDMTLSEIGKEFGVSREAVRQSLKRAIDNIRTYAS
jgi:RNA polymerase sigma factor (sigma-70 family)